jgi:hypothetical protein
LLSLLRPFNPNEYNRREETWPEENHPASQSKGINLMLPKTIGAFRIIGIIQLGFPTNWSSSSFKFEYILE